MQPPVIETLSNGMTVAVVNAPESHQVQVSLMVCAGSRFESPRTSGAFHFLEHMLFRGSRQYPSSEALSLAFEPVGTQPNAMTGVEYTEFDFIAHPDKLSEALLVLAELACEPMLSEMEKERAIIQDEIQYDYNEQGELISLPTLVAELLWPGHPLGLSVTGTLATLAGIDESTLLGSHDRHYRPENLVLGLVGRVDPTAAVKAAEKAFGFLQRRGERIQPRLYDPQADEEKSTSNVAEFATPLSTQLSLMNVQPPQNRPGDPRIKTVVDPDNQFHLQLSFPAPGYNAPQEAALVLLTRILDDGSTTRLQQAVREQTGLAYHVSADYSGFQDVGQYDVATSLVAGRLGDGLSAIVNVLTRLREDGPEAEELARAKRRHHFDLEFARDDLRTAMDRQVWPLLYSTPRSEAEELEEIEAVTPAQLREVAQKILRKEKASLAMVGPVDEPAQAILHLALEKL